MKVSFRFYEELNDFLPEEKKKQTFEYTFTLNQTIKDAIEASGVPHVEVDLILVNSSPVDFSYKLRDDDIVSVYPVFESMDITNASPLREKPLRDIKFINDVHLGKLTKYLRLCGFDTAYRNSYIDKEIVSIAIEEKRVILTRDLQLLKNKSITHGYFLRSQFHKEQLLEVLGRFDLKDQITLFKRCMECNELLKLVDKSEISHRLQPKTILYYKHFSVCPGCDRIYWEGTHTERMKVFIESLNQDL